MLLSSFENVIIYICFGNGEYEEREENKGKIRFLMGESMGGAVVLLLARKKPDFWDGAVLAAPMCKVCVTFFLGVVIFLLSLL